MARGEAIAKVEGAIKRVDAHTYFVKSQSGKGEYQVVSCENGWLCPCLDSKFRQVKCKHIWAVEFSRKLRERVLNDRIIQPVNVSACPSCQSLRIVKRGIRHNDYGDIQQFICKDCHRTFVVNLGFERMHATPQAITQAMQLYFSGESLRGAQKFLRLQGVYVSHVAILKWIRKYVALMDRYLVQIAPKVSDTWRADELYVKFKGDRKYVFAVMDDETRFWIAQEVSQVKEGANASRLFIKAKQAARKEPTALITDALGSYKMAAELDFPHATHTREIAFAGGIHNNKMERMNGEVRDRERVMRGLKRTDTPILKGIQLYHNFIRPHEGLNGDTPADRAGIKVKGENKWLTLIQNASKKAEP
jgi:transposase-like protein